MASDLSWSSAARVRVPEKSVIIDALRLMGQDEVYGTQEGVRIGWENEG